MLAIILMMSLGVLIATAVAIYVAFPHRGEQLPVVPQLGNAMRKGVDALPTLEDAESAPDATSELSQAGSVVQTARSPPARAQDGLIGLRHG